ncbi:hypothetical protein SERLA73DRAFT_158919 [Serpula lacrymans var. lacrymans S7.3]|uniref:C2H2-type domain-containing protein n=2 Tax=Serpula lacrymans var. lacrymans TaxID=341189 RepID=F8PNI4_SERL3|nr:uncharacterized protein SERLADRAFT_435128 [Serpula lacrymans var. lacrymans S7.9]EGO01711.1 hypothetical protein SERLA73DRAFT_158919 [Serpula lacrymans var. lacrymans S7.3]EGO27354.1 hypothetical protein SERLADRAFT_435128 [Serpula lacrymans var. lacrymans S7.9]
MDSDFQSNVANFDNSSFSNTRSILTGLGITYGNLSEATQNMSLLDISNRQEVISSSDVAVVKCYMKRSASKDSFSSSSDFSPTTFWASDNDSGSTHERLEGVSEALQRHLGVRSPLSQTRASSYSPWNKHTFADSTDSTASERNVSRALALHDTPNHCNAPGIFADVNMFSMAALEQENNIGVNPMDTVGQLPDSVVSNDMTVDSVQAVQIHPLPPLSPHCSPRLSIRDKEVSFSEVIKDIVAILSNSVKDETLQKSDLNGTKASPAHRIELDKQMESAAAVISNAQIDPRLLSASMQGNDFPSSGVLPPHETFQTNGGQLPLKMDTYDPSCHSPILNAHLGIGLDELIFRADRYRMRHPGEEVDKQWLMHFAGKLSERGELLDEFRCYVAGCEQKNKRRDHILVHIGAHIDQRPFQCAVCPMRFLRKNECKRHEASHTGYKPYTCMICLEDKSFARQDLLKRHLKRTHSIGSKDDGRRPRKKMRVD